MNKGPHEVIELVQHSINHFDEQMSFLIFKSLFHEKGKNLIKERSGTKLSCIVGQLPKRGLTHWWCTVLYLQQ